MFGKVVEPLSCGLLPGLPGQVCQQSWQDPADNIRCLLAALPPSLIASMKREGNTSLHTQLLDYIKISQIFICIYYIYLLWQFIEPAVLFVGDQ